MKEKLQNLREDRLIEYLKGKYANGVQLTDVDKKVLKNHNTSSYALWGIIGLLTENKPRILLGKKQTYDRDIHKWCSEVNVSKDELMKIADKYLEDDFSEEPELILRKVMLEYPIS